MHIAEEELERVLRHDELTLEDIKSAMRTARYNGRSAELIDYANTLLSGSGDYLPPHILISLVRADISVDDALHHLKKNKAFFVRLAELLPSLIRSLDTENLRGVLLLIDDCHHDYHVATTSQRKDRMLRETKESILKAFECSVHAVAALESAKRHIDIEFDHYRRVLHPEAEKPLFVGQLIDELRFCAGVGNCEGRC
jgi:hypothetical protein